MRPARRIPRLAEGGRVPSTHELAAFYRINPATVAKGINVLADDGLLEKRQGIGMFVATLARSHGRRGGDPSPGGSAFPPAGYP